jgi:hypothetical protein
LATIRAALTLFSARNLPLRVSPSETSEVSLAFEPSLDSELALISELEPRVYLVSEAVLAAHAQLDR